jgi:hypothetical protein
MKQLFILSVLFAAFNSAQAQVAKEYKIGASGATVRMICNPGAFPVENNEFEEDEDTPEEEKDKSVAMTGKCASGGLTYGVVYNDAGRPQEFEEGYTIEDHLKSTLAGHRDLLNCKGTFITGIQKSPDGKTVSVTDAWESYNGNWYQVKAYTNGQVFVLLYVEKKTKFSTNAVVKAFLDSFRFGPVNK